MKRFFTIASAAIFAAALASCGGNQNTEETSTEEKSMEEQETTNTGTSGQFKVSTDDSRIMWEGNMLAIGGVSLYGHQGTLNIAKGQLNMTDGVVTDGTIVVDMTTIAPTDDNYDPEEGKSKDKLIGHLSSDDFFAVEEYPTATFVVTGADNDVIKGDMTIRGVTNPESITDFTIDAESGKMKAKGTMTLDRQKYEVAFSMSAEDKILSDDIVLSFDLVAEDGKTASK
ncbi:MAG: YceI family protein [Cryomorphaceae bacterium]|nr:YceI family protein [Flavobacteriales bacterium]